MPDIITPKPAPILVDPTWTLRGPEDNLYFQHDHDVSDTFLDRIKHTRTASPNTRESDFMELCEIPIGVVDEWMREGFDIYKENAKSILKRLSAENLGAFISTSKGI